ncbi:LCP family protein [Streptomyces sannanensis]|uniref:LCP family protein n=1 Tax=Streptomyces sannanensis TaxID=285536 RepID=A0ABP6SBE0_9ACTN
MDAQSRGQADGMDPADQWVLNPDTGNYELRLDSSPEQPKVNRPRSASRSRSAAHGRKAASDRVPGQRGRRGANASDDSAGGAGRRKRKQQKSGKKKKALVWTGGVMAFVLVGGSAFAYYWYERLNGNISTIDVGDAANGSAIKDGPMNILVIGTDKRTGKGNEAYGDRDNATGHADTTILFHVSEDRTNATALSIPRDLKTEIPDCPTKQPDGSIKVIPGQYTRFNESLGVNGRDPGCTMRTVKKLTGLDVDHFMMVDFNAVKTLSTAVGGVTVCLEQPIKDEKSKLDLPSGESKVMGEQALSFVRNRHGLKNESDLDRIEMQQQFLASMMRQLKEDSLDSPTKMLDIADAATDALTVDKAIGSANKLITLAKELSKIDLKNITLMTVPVVDNPDEPVGRKATVVLNPVEAPPVFSMLQNDVSFTEVKKKEKDTKNKQAALLNGPRADASAVRVEVLNGGALGGSAQKVLEWLQLNKGVQKSSNGGNAPKDLAKTTLEYAPNQADQARELADLMGLPATALKPGTADAAELTPMTLTLGADFKGAGVSIAPPKKIPDVKKSHANEQKCAGS